jgi:hypothetical protein
MPSAIVIGGADCVWDDVKAARALFEPDAFAVLNDMVPCWSERIDYLCSLHPEKVADWLNHRAKNGYQFRGEVWCHKNAGPRGLVHKGVDRTTDDWAGSSSLFAAKVLIEERFDKIVLCGCPLVSEAGHIARKRHWMAAHAFRSGWKRNHSKIADKVRSMGGWTREFLGAPTPEWLAT